MEWRGEEKTVNSKYGNQLGLAFCVMSNVEDEVMFFSFDSCFFKNTPWYILFSNEHQDRIENKEMDMCIVEATSLIYCDTPFAAFASRLATTWLCESGPLAGASSGFRDDKSTPGTEASSARLGRKGIGVEGLLARNCRYHVSSQSQFGFCKQTSQRRW